MPNFLENLQSCPVDPFPGLRGLVRPGLQRTAAFAPAQQLVALAQAAAELPPVGQECGFHVKRGPVQVIPAVPGARLDQPVTVRVDRDHGQDAGMVGNGADRPAVAVELPLPGRLADSQVLAHPGMPDRTGYRDLPGAPAQQGFQLAAAKGAAAAQEIDGLQDAGLAGAVGPAKHRDLFTRRDFQVLQDPEIPGLEGAQHLREQAPATGAWA